VQLTVTEAFAIVRSDTMTFQDVSQRECGRLERDPLAQKACTADVTEEARRIVIDARNRTAEFAAAMRSVLQSLQAMKAAFLAVADRPGADAPALLASLTRYRNLYLAADGRPEPLIDEWVAYVASRAKRDAVARSRPRPLPRRRAPPPHDSTP
jgi:hypothetical protein